LVSATEYIGDGHLETRLQESAQEPAMHFVELRCDIEEATWGFPGNQIDIIGD
jgi:hypothetical protein